MGVFAGIGVALAFVPVGGRPLDKMLVYFIKSVPKENQFVYRKQGVDLAQYEFLKPPKVVQQAPQQQAPEQNVNKNVLASALRNSYFRPDEQEVQYITSLKSSFENPQAAAGHIHTSTTADSKASEVVANMPRGKIAPVIPAPATPITPPQPIKQAAALEAHPQPTSVSQTQPSTPVPSDPTRNNLQSTPQTQTAMQPSAATPVIPTAPAPEPKITVSVAPSTPPAPLDAKAQPEPITPPAPQATTSQSILDTGFPSLPDTPNIVLGIIKDPRGKVLPNILVEVVDMNEIPVRAFKTNTLGKFISATPLPDGKYKMHFDDPSKKHEFETVEVEMKGEIFYPLVIVSIDQREKLRRELFGNQPLVPQTPAPAINV